VRRGQQQQREKEQEQGQEQEQEEIRESLWHFITALERNLFPVYAQQDIAHRVRIGV